MPHLGFLLEGQPNGVPRHNHVEALTPNVRRKVFPKHPPRPAQERAIEVALNTPDIALIQGPPGTGKTTVIRAILERLNEMAKGEGNLTGEFLLSGFQHDAVENAAGRIDINGLPPIKFGSRSGEGSSALDLTEVRVDEWREERADKLRERLADLDLPVSYQRMADLVEAYTLTPTLPAAAAQTLREAVATAEGGVPGELLDRMRTEAEALEAEELDGADEGRAGLYRCARALRISPTAFADDGVQNAALLLRRLRNGSPVAQLPPGAMPRLERFAASQWPSDAEGWEAVRRLRRSLLHQFAPRYGQRVPAVLQDVVALLAEARDELEHRYRRSLDGPTAALADYVGALENAPDEVLHAIVSYSSVFAATCQQSSRYELAEAKAAEDGEYDTVVVDEAARANPLDLFVPLVRGRRRIVLVGDHRQLPHLIDDRIARRLEDADEESEESAQTLVQEEIKRSLFEHLFEDFRRLHLEDGQPCRTVTLDAQFRMHPLLGAFVSRNFYEVHGEPKIESPIPASAFEHHLPGFEGLAAAWLDVPAACGREERSGKSWIRPAEGRLIARRIAELVDSEEGRALSFGVISFYKKQVGDIEEALADERVLERMPDGTLGLPERLRVHHDAEGHPTGEARLRVGTVDAFQGREFDVVFLSVVRSNDRPDRTERERRGRFGHLMSPNRLNVGMSRQKRLLVVVGDQALVESPHAGEAVSPLLAFRDLTRSSDLADFFPHDGVL